MKLKTRKSDILFCRLTAAFNFLEESELKSIIREIAVLDALGIKKRVPELLYEKGRLTRYQIKAIFDALFANNDIKKIKHLKAYRFSDEDEAAILQELQISPEAFKQAGQEVARRNEAGENITLQDVFAEQGFLTPEQLAVCFDLQEKINEAGFSRSLLHILVDKNMLTASIKQALQKRGCRKVTISSPKNRSPSSVRKSITILLWQLAKQQELFSGEQCDQAYEAWETAIALDLELRYSEVLFYTCGIEPDQIVPLTATLKTLTNFDQTPRLFAFHLDQEEKQIFAELQEQQIIAEEILQECRDLAKQLQEKHMSVPLGDLLILRRYHTKNTLLKLWQDTIGKHTDEQRVSQIVKQSQSFQQQARTQLGEVARRATRQARDYLRKSGEFVNTLSAAYEQHHQKQQEVIDKDIEELRRKLRSASEQAQRELEAKLAHYEQIKKEKAAQPKLLEPLKPFWWFVGYPLIAAVLFLGLILIYNIYQRRQEYQQYQLKQKKRLAQTIRVGRPQVAGQVCPLCKGKGHGLRACRRCQEYLFSLHMPLAQALGPKQKTISRKLQQALQKHDVRLGPDTVVTVDDITARGRPTRWCLRSQGHEYFMALRGSSLQFYSAPQGRIRCFEGKWLRCNNGYMEVKVKGKWYTARKPRPDTRKRCVNGWLCDAYLHDIMDKGAKVPCPHCLHSRHRGWRVCPCCKGKKLVPFICPRCGPRK